MTLSLRVFPAYTTIETDPPLLLCVDVRDSAGNEAILTVDADIMAKPVFAYNMVQDNGQQMSYRWDERRPVSVKVYDPTLLATLCNSAMVSCDKAYWASTNHAFRIFTKNHVRVLLTEVSNKLSITAAGGGRRRQGSGRSGR